VRACMCAFVRVCVGLARTVYTPYMTVYLDFLDFSAKNTVTTPYTYSFGQPYVCVSVRTCVRACMLKVAYLVASAMCALLCQCAVQQRQDLGCSQHTSPHSPSTS